MTQRMLMGKKNIVGKLSLFYSNVKEKRKKEKETYQGRTHLTTSDKNNQTIKTNLNLDITA